MGDGVAGCTAPPSTMMPSTCSGSAGWGKRDSSGIASHEPIGSSAMASKLTEAMAMRREPRRRRRLPCLTVPTASMSTSRLPGAATIQKSLPNTKPMASNALPPIRPSL